MDRDKNRILTRPGLGPRPGGNGTGAGAGKKIARERKRPAIGSGHTV
jgi:hypothetical protein